MESVSDEFGDAAGRYGERIDDKTGGVYSDQVRSATGPLPDDGDPSEATEPSSGEAVPTAEPIFESVERDLNGGPSMP